MIACDSVEALAKTNAKRVRVAGSVKLDGLQGIRDMKKQEDGMSFLYSGEMSVLIQRLSEGKIKDVTITEPDLEEIFLHYYE